MPKSLNEIKLANMQAELLLATGCDNEPRIKKLREDIAAIQRDEALRLECGLLPGNYPADVVQ